MTVIEIKLYFFRKQSFTCRRNERIGELESLKINESSKNVKIRRKLQRRKYFKSVKLEQMISTSRMISSGFETFVYIKYNISKGCSIHPNNLVQEMGQ